MGAVAVLSTTIGAQVRCLDAVAVVSTTIGARVDNRIYIA